MRILLLALCVAVIGLAAGCARSPATPEPVMQYPPTWTPSATPPPTAVPPKATRVIPETTPVPITPDANLKALPVSPADRIGIWLETARLSSELVEDAAPDTQVVTGPLALALKSRNRDAFAFRRLDALDSISAMSGLNLEPGYAGNIVEAGGMTDGDQLQGTADQLRGLRVALGTRLLIADTYAWTDGAAFLQHEKDRGVLLEQVDGVCLCNFLRRADSPLNQFKTEAAWRQDVDALAALSNNRALVVLVAVPFGKSDPKPTGNPVEWTSYALGSFLLGVSNTHSFLSLQGESADRLFLSPILASSIGAPLGAYIRTGAGYERRFSKGIVLVNPLAEPRTRVLTRQYKNASNEIVSRVTLAPHSSVILFDAK